MATYVDTIPLKRGINKDGAYWCQNIRPAGDDGVLAGISLVNGSVRETGTPTDTLRPIVSFIQVGGSYPFGRVVGRDTLGDIYFMPFTGVNAVKAMTYSKTIGSAEGFMMDTNGTIVYTGSRYIGREYHTTLNGDITSSSDSIVLTDATNFPSAGYGFINDMNNSEVIQWTGKSSNTLTGVTRGKYFTTPHAHSSGTTIYYFKDDWKDFGSENIETNRRCITWDIWNFFVNGNVISGYSQADASDFKTCITLSPDKSIVDIGQLDTSSTSYLLIGANSGENGYIYTWDGKDTVAICEKELNNNNITRIYQNYIATNNGIYRYDGTNLELITQPIDSSNSLFGRLYVNDIKIIKNYLLFTGGVDDWNRNRNGLWVVDLETKDMFFILPSNYGWYGILYYGIFSVDKFILVGTSYSEGAIDRIEEQPAPRGSLYQFIYKPTNSKTLQLKNIKLNIATDIKTYYNNSNFNFDVIIRGYDFTRPFIQRSQLKSGETPIGSSQLIIRDDIGVPEIGDRVEIIQRDSSNFSNVAEAFRNITAITPGTGKYIIDVDEPFPEAISSLTQNNSLDVLFHPLKKLGRGKISINSSQLNLYGYNIPLAIQPRFKKMLFEIEVRCNNTNISPELNSIEITYSD